MVDDYPKRLAESLLMEADAADAGAQAGIQGMHILGKKFRSAAETIAALEARLAETAALWHERSGTCRLQDIRIAGLEAALRRIAASHGASDHACFRRDLADQALTPPETVVKP